MQWWESGYDLALEGGATKRGLKINGGDVTVCRISTQDIESTALFHHALLQRQAATEILFHPMTNMDICLDCMLLAVSHAC